MRDALQHIEEIRTRVSSAGYMLLLDFDGTLSPIVPIPDDAQIESRLRETLVECSRTHPIAIVSGRSLADIEKRVGIDTIWYAGSHGLEWKAIGEADLKETPEPQRSAIDAVRALFRKTADEEAGLIFEDKVHCAAINYRALSDADAALFSSRMFELISPYAAKGLRVMDGMRTFEVSPAIDWTKGECSQMLLKMAREKSGAPLIPIYIGDSITDEDAFRVLREGVTVRVGPDPLSAAEFFVPSQSDVVVFLTQMCEKNTL